ncbi:Wzz/FepE/Etk N-terminal domain-containing protein [Thioalkalivibrio sp. ALMg3]|uniref:Wzz/FepE/Etk N-terminal domain-containing protein n=1 Tax=Thioalkalivibrio sp. ALMg3 TaxID=1158163 RepID=UPI000367CB27|nr:Wzz/FepE/Etk N-terminal domain-containing protein [Thioalkalivibrio sp. ALMg3]
MNDPAGNPQARLYDARPYDDEISLYELWDVLVRRLPVLLGVAVLTVVLGVVYALMQSVEYEYRSGVDLPRVYSGGLANVVSQDMAIARLEDVLIPQERDQLFGDEERGPRVRVSAHGSEYSLILESTSTREAAEHVADLHEGVIAAMAEWLRPRFEQSLASHLRPLNSRIEVLDDQIALLQEDLNALYGRLGEGDDIAGLIVAQQIGDIRRELSRLRSSRTDAASSAETVVAMSRDTEQTFLAGESDDPAGAGRSLIVALSVVLGGMLGLFAAFFWEFVSNARSRRPEQG